MNMLKGRLGFVNVNNHCMEPRYFLWSYLRMMKPADSFMVPGDTSVKASSYNDGIYKALNLGAEWLFLMDVDQQFPPMTIPLMAETVEKYGAKIVSGLYQTKVAPWAPVAGWAKDFNGKVLGVNVHGRPWKSEFSELNAKDPSNPIVEVDWVGSGCLLIHKSVIEAIEWPPFEDIWEKGRGVRSEGHDINFCLRAKDKGFKTYVDTRIISAHGGFYYFDHLFAKAAHECGLLQHMTGIAQNQTLEKDYWDTIWSEEFLKNASREGHYPETLRDIAAEIPEKAKVADIGSGPGVLLKKLREAKSIEGTGYDFSAKAVEILKTQGFDGKVADIRTYAVNGDSQTFDVVVSAHTIEHLRDDAKLISLMKSLCKPGGKVVIATPWREEIQGHFEHVRGYSDADMDALMKAHFTSYEVRKNNRDYVAVGINS